MSLDALLVHDVTIVEPGTTTNSYNDARPDWTDPTRTSERARISQRSALEVLGVRDATVDEWRFYGEADSAITARSRVEWGAETFEVVGEPARPVRRTSAVHHTEAVLRKVEG